MSPRTSCRGLADLTRLPGALRALGALLVTAVTACACGTAAPTAASGPGQSSPTATLQAGQHQPSGQHKPSPSHTSRTTAGCRCRSRDSSSSHNSAPGAAGSTSPGGSGSSPGSTSPGSTSPGSPGASGCQSTFVPAYFYSSAIWAQAIGTRPAPSVILLNVDSGPGTGPLSHFQTVVRQAQAAGITVLGYSSTSYGQSAISSVETQVREYRSWYGVNGIFLDLTQGTPGEFSYYRTLTDFVRSTIPNGVVWLNPGDYPAPEFMSIANVVMVFEGPYSAYLSDQVPSWISQYSPGQFAHVIYETPPSDMASAVSLSRKRRAGHLFVTDLSGSGNPYGALPSYWSREAGDVPAPC
jgi:Spherulation-specific family 4